MVSSKAAAVVNNHGVRQFFKFAIVGVSSTVISFTVLNLALLALHGHRYISATAAFLIAVINSYIWNKRWTFKGARDKELHTQFAQFMIVNLVGLALNLAIIRLVSVPLESGLHLSMIKATNVAQLAATGIVVFWNFFANRFWTFKH